jgi:hypothetical protein
VTAHVAIARDRQTLVETPLTLEAPDAGGWTRRMSVPKVGSLSPGSYALVPTITDGASRQIRSVRFDVRPTKK